MKASGGINFVTGGTHIHGLTSFWYLGLFDKSEVLKTADLMCF